MYKITRAGIVALTGAGIVLAGAAPAIAAPQPGDCPPKFLIGFVDEESGPLLGFDKNGDSFICLLPLRNGNFNVIDNKVRPSRDA